mmetsp:Transcript_84351/g.141002  ORF Transcript_84351/g.141002 Transcript_84351/m.141002 type:complete len:82 (+) Transcript_84351:695-940(+)
MHHISSYRLPGAHAALPNAADPMPHALGPRPRLCAPAGQQVGRDNSRASSEQTGPLRSWTIIVSTDLVGGLEDSFFSVNGP